MAKKFQNLRNSMSQERREKIDAMTKDMLVEMPMHEPRVKGMVGISYAVSPIGADHIVAEHDTDFDFEAPDVYIEHAKPLGLLERLPTESIESRKCFTQMLDRRLDLRGC